MIVLALALLTASDGAWPRHTIDTGPRGADGVRLADLDGDGDQDLCVPFEEGGRVRVYRQPEDARERWPFEEVGEVASPEDAVFVDLDSDGVLEVVTCCEGRTRALFVHRRGEEGWTTAPFPQAAGRQWMFAAAHPDGLVIGAKGEGATISLLTPPAEGQDLAAWTLRDLRPAGWIMSLVVFDVDGDGDQDVIYSDRKGERREVGWLERGDEGWSAHTIGAADGEVMFLAVDRFGGKPSVVAPLREGRLVHLTPGESVRDPWRALEIEWPRTVAGDPVGVPKAVRRGDLDGDGDLDLALTAGLADGPKTGVFWLRRDEDGWTPLPIGGAEGAKFDRIELLDLDDDGDLDLVTTEERDGLGVVWYENPAQR